MLAFPTPQDEDDQVLSVGQIAGIVIGVSVGTLLLVTISVLVGYCLWCVCVCVCCVLCIVCVVCCVLCIVCVVYCVLCVCVSVVIDLLHINYIYIGFITWMDDSHLLRKVLRKILISV